MAKVFSYDLDKWVSIRPSIQESFEEMNHRIDILSGLGLSGIHIGLHGYLEYLVGADSQNIRDKNDTLIQKVENLGLECLTSGLSLTKHQGLARKMSIPITLGSPQPYIVAEFGTTDSDGFLNLKKTGLFVRGVKKNTLFKIYGTVAGKGGTIYINHPNSTHIQKMVVSKGEFIIPFINLEGITADSIFYKGTPNDKVSISRIVLNDYKEDELNENAEWVGNKTSGFLNCRMPDLMDKLGVFSSFFALKLMSGHRKVSVCDEINSPWFHDQQLIDTYDGGWPQALGEYISTYCHIYFQLFHHDPIIFMTDTRKNIEEIRYNRFCRPVPLHATADYLQYIEADTPINLLLWAEGGKQEMWEDMLRRTDKFENRTIGVYAGFQNVDIVFNAISSSGIDKQTLDYAEFHWNREYPNTVQTIDQIKNNLGQ